MRLKRWKGKEGRIDEGRSDRGEKNEIEGVKSSREWEGKEASE